MKSQQIPEHKMNFTGEVSQALENSTNNKMQDSTTKVVEKSNQINLKNNKVKG